MHTIYFRTQQGINHFANLRIDTGFGVNQHDHLICGCGPKRGYLVKEKRNDIIIEHLILCENCYENAPIQDRGE